MTGEIIVEKKKKKRSAFDIFYSILVIFLIALIPASIITGYFLVQNRNEESGPHHGPYVFRVEDGNNYNETYGCFFTIYGGIYIDIDPIKYSFYIAERNETPKQLNFDIRTYDRNGNPTGGDRNGTFDYTKDGNKIMTEGEYIGFDMPKKDMGFDVVDGNRYDIFIMNHENDLVYVGDFVYQPNSI